MNNGERSSWDVAGGQAKPRPLLRPAPFVKPALESADIESIDKANSHGRHGKLRDPSSPLVMMEEKCATDAGDSAISLVHGDAQQQQLLGNAEFSQSFSPTSIQVEIPLISAPPKGGTPTKPQNPPPITYPNGGDPNRYASQTQSPEPTLISMPSRDSTSRPQNPPPVTRPNGGNPNRYPLQTQSREPTMISVPPKETTSTTTTPPNPPPITWPDGGLYNSYPSQTQSPEPTLISIPPKETTTTPQNPRPVTGPSSEPPSRHPRSKTLSWADIAVAGPDAIVTPAAPQVGPTYRSAVETGKRTMTREAWLASLQAQAILLVLLIRFFYRGKV